MQILQTPLVQNINSHNKKNSWSRKDNDYISNFFSTVPIRLSWGDAQEMENLNFENFFGSSVAIHDSKAVSCAYREMPKDEKFTKSESTTGENIYIFFSFFLPF